MLLEIDWQGARQVRTPHPAVGADLHPAAVARIAARSGSKSAARTAPAVIARRLDAAREEMRHCGEFDYVIMNQDFARAVDDLSVIVRAARLAASRQLVRHARTLSPT